MAESLRELVERVREARERLPCGCSDCRPDDPRLNAERALCDALLTSRAVEAVEGEATLREALAAATERAERAERERDALASEAVDRLMLVASLRTRAEQAEAAARTYRLAMALALSIPVSSITSIPVSSITVESAQAWIDDWKARNE